MTDDDQVCGDPLGGYLAAELEAATGSSEPDRAAVLDLWAELFGGDGSALDLGLFEDALSTSPDTLQFEAGSWTLDLPEAHVRAPPARDAEHGGLALLGLVPLAPILVPAVIPIMFDLRRTSALLSAK